MFKIQDIKLGGEDETGAKIISVFAKVKTAYAVYGTEDRVLVQFSDDPILGGDQRKLLAPLGPLRGEIDGLIDGWRKARRQAGRKRGLRSIFAPGRDEAAKAAFFDRRVADALVIALQGGASEAAAILAAVKFDVAEERTSVARGEYVLVAGLLLLMLLAVIAVITSMGEADAPLPKEDGKTQLAAIGHNAIGFAAALGGVGALFSIALAIRSRELLTDLQSRDNIIDAAMRILIGAVSAALLYCLLAARYLSFSLGGDIPLQLGAWQPGLAVVAFVAGFSERLVGNMLGRASLGAVPTAVAHPTARAVNGQASAANERNPLGRAAAGAAGAAAAGAAATTSAVNDDEEMSEGGHVHSEAEDEALTSDVELPEATGGVERTN